MNDLEQRLRAVMLAHDPEAPTASELRVPRAGSPNRTRVAIVAAVFVVLGMAGAAAVFSATERRDASPIVTAGGDAPLACPASYQHPANAVARPWVPSLPTVAQPSARMVPTETPNSVVICGYKPTGNSGRALHGDLSVVADELAWLPAGSPRRGCALSPAKNSGDYLVGLTYPHGTVWVSAPGDRCQGSTNGRFTSSANLSAAASQAATTGEWTPVTSTPTCIRVYGRLGQNHALVPDGATHVYACTNQKNMVDLTDHLAQLIGILGSVKATPASDGCDAIGVDQSAPTHELIFTYPVGSPTTLYIVAGCRPAISNGDLGINAGTQFLDPILALIEQR